MYGMVARVPDRAVIGTFLVELFAAMYSPPAALA
jgi:hypothetical protein